jgi:hypothetical protein
MKSWVCAVMTAFPVPKGSTRRYRHHHPRLLARIVVSDGDACTVEYFRGRKVLSSPSFDRLHRMHRGQVLYSTGGHFGRNKHKLWHWNVLRRAWSILKQQLYLMSCWKYLPSTGADQEGLCVKCNAGKYPAAPASTFCTECTAGKYLVNPGMGGVWSVAVFGCLYAVQCKHLLDQNGSTACAQCAQGSFSKSVKTTCGDVAPPTQSTQVLQIQKQYAVKFVLWFPMSQDEFNKKGNDVMIALGQAAEVDVIDVEFEVLKMPDAPSQRRWSFNQSVLSHAKCKPKKC